MVAVQLVTAELSVARTVMAGAAVLVVVSAVGVTVPSTGFSATPKLQANAAAARRPV